MPRSAGLVAGIDIGNTTTEIVVAELRRTVAVPVRRGSVLTSGRKGSPQAVDAAWRLLSRLETAAGVCCDEIAIASYEPVITGIRTFGDSAAYPARLVRIDHFGAYTPFGRGFAWGRPASLGEFADSRRRRGPAYGSAEPVVVLVPAGVDFAEAARNINAAVRRGVSVAGVLAGGDDAVLIGHRLDKPLPVIDEVDIDRAAAAAVVLLEVAAAGRPLQTLADPLALRAALGAALGESGADDADLREVEEVAKSYVDARCGAVVWRPRAAGGHEQEPSGAWVEFIDADGELRRSTIIGNLHELSRSIVPGAVRALYLPGGRTGGRRTASRRAEPDGVEEATDFYAPDLPGILARPVLRRGSVAVLEAPAAVLGLGAGRDDARALLEELSGRPVIVAAGEAHAARRGALTTPGAPAGAAVCDIGGGTIDLVDEHRAVVAAGAGELLTLSVGMAAGISRSTAERVKRYRSFRVESPRLVHDEDGNRRFVTDSEYGRYVGRLCVDSGRGILPFHGRLSPEEWRILRLTLKEEVLGANVRRALRALGTQPAELVLCGGCALDDELVRVVADSLREERVLVGRANVAGGLGPRYAVALGLVISRVDERS